MFKDSKWLNKLYKNKNINTFIDNYKEYLTKNNFMGSGKHVYCYSYDEKYVLKICPKKIRFFKNNIGDPNIIINNMNLVFPRIRTLYDDDNIYVYIQKKCKPINSLDINISDTYLILNILIGIVLMINSNLIINDIKKHNIGRYHNKLYIFDWHGLYLINNIEDIVNTRITINIIEYLNIHNYKQYSSMVNINSSYIELKKICINIYNNIYKDEISLLTPTQIKILNNKYLNSCSNN